VSSCFAAGAILAKLAYNDGANALTIVTVRTVAAVFWLVLLLSVARISLTLPPKLRVRALALGALLAVQTYGMYSAIEHMAAPLAVLTFSTHPILTAAAEAYLGRTRFRLKQALALVLAFSGLVLTLNAGELRPSTYGIIAGTIGSIGFAATMILTSRLFPLGDSRPRTAHMTASASALFILACLVTGSFTLPATTIGMIGFWGVCISFPIALTGLFMAVQSVGPSRTSFLLNFEPVAVTILSALFLGQTLSGWQLVGGGMVISAIIYLQWPSDQSSP
jgi:drug/metabolite transporter (DMT)-like permease